MDIKIEIAKEKDIETIHDLIVKRCKWFDENNIKQWNMSYAKRYDNDNKEYLRLDCFKSNIKLNNYYKNLGFEKKDIHIIYGNLRYDKH